MKNITYASLSPESRYELQLIDTNCNDCLHMKRDVEKQKYWKEKSIAIQQDEFNRKKKVLEKALERHTKAKKVNREAVIQITNELQKLKFQPSKATGIGYGICAKNNCEVSFIPEVCMPENRLCFEHRLKVV